MIAWGWRPKAPPALESALAQRKVRRPALFRAGGLEGSAVEWAAYRFNFAQLAKMTPDLALYRLVRLFNTPLLTVSTREAGHANWAFWQGHVQPIVPPAGGVAGAHLWFFDDASDGDVVVLEYGFDGELTLRTALKPLQQLERRYAQICARVNAPDAGLTETRVRIPPPEPPIRP